MKSKTEKQAEAQARQAKYDSLTRDEKAKLVYSRPGKSARELARLFP